MAGSDHNLIAFGRFELDLDRRALSRETFAHRSPIESRKMDQSRARRARRARILIHMRRGAPL